MIEMYLLHSGKRLKTQTGKRRSTIAIDPNRHLSAVLKILELKMKNLCFLHSITPENSLKLYECRRELDEKEALEFSTTHTVVRLLSCSYLACACLHGVEATEAIGVENEDVDDRLTERDIVVGHCHGPFDSRQCRQVKVTEYRKVTLNLEH
jgi:hypothetical protein